jgi:hypothetical protein
MILYRFLSPAEEEMSDAALFYETATGRLGADFLDDVQRAIDRLRKYPHSGESVAFGEPSFTVFRLVSSTLWKKMRLSSSR